MLTQIVVFIFISVFLGLSQTAGVGGGPLVNIFLMIGMGYDTKLSISITYIFLIGGSIASIWKNSVKKNPKTGTSYVNLDLIILTVPTMTSGSLFGSVLKNFLSELFITIFFIVLFVYLIMDIRKNLAKLKQEQNASLLIGTTKSALLKQREMNNIVNPYAQSTPQPLQQQLQPSSQNKLNYLIKLVAGYYIFTALASLCKGGPKHGSILGIDPCGFWGFTILIIHAAVSAWVSVQSANKIISQNTKLSKLNPNPSEQISVNADNVMQFILAGFCAGIVGATLAIGGALILIPVWLKLGIDKDVAASSTATLIMTSALVAATVSFFNQVYSQISIFLLIFYFVLAFVSAAIVKDFLTYVSNKYKSKSLVLWVLLIVVVISLVVLVPFQGYKMVTNFERFSKFSTLC